MQSLSFTQVQGPVSISKSIGSSNPLSQGDESRSFDSLLAGLLGSGGYTQATETSEEILQNGLEELEKSGIYGTLLDTFINIPKTQGESLDISKELSQLLVDLENIENPEELELELELKLEPELEFELIKEKIVNLLKVNSPISESLIKKLFSEENINLQELSLKEKKIFTSVLTKELIQVLKESPKVDLIDTTQKLDSLKDIVLKSVNPLTSILEITGRSKEGETVFQSSLADEVKAILNSEKIDNVKLAGGEVNSQKEQVTEEIKTNSGMVQEKTDLSFQKSLDNNVSKLFEQEQVQEKLEPKNIPKYIENQIKNSFKTGESGYREITVKIHPEHLGKIVLKIATSEESNMSVKILAESKNIKEFLDTNLTTLRSNLESSGIKNGSFNIEIDFEKNFNQSNGSNQNFSGNSNKGERKDSSEEQSFEERIESIFNNSGGLEVLA